MPLPDGLQKKYIALVGANGLQAELQAAYTYVNSLEIAPTGIKAPVRTYDNVKKVIQATGTAMFGGSLSQLDLQRRAINDPLTSKLHCIIGTAKTDSALHKLMDCIVVNVDASSPASYVRANKDAEVDALCLLMYWCRHDKALTARLNMIAADLAFEGRAMGDDTNFFWAKRNLMEAEENRGLIGERAMRMCQFFNAQPQIEADGRHDESDESDEGDGEKMMKVMSEDCTRIEDC